jgi:hypothetical protein
VKLVNHALVAFGVPLEFVLPKFRAGLWRVGRLAALVTMPKATMYEDCKFPLRQHEIRTPGQSTRMKAEAKATSM